MRLRPALIALLLTSLMVSSYAAAPKAKAPIAPPADSIDLKLSTTWKFCVDTGDQGSVGKWFDPGFNDSAWQSLSSGKSWQKQGITHNGWGWFRQTIVVPAELAGTPITLSLGENQSDDDVWFNGQHVGGLHGKYKYKNLLRRVYTIPTSAIRYGQPNTIATRIWGGNLLFIGQASMGLVEGTFSATMDPYYVTMRKPGGVEVPAQLFDLSDAQRGSPFEILFRVPKTAAVDSATLACELKDFYGQSIATLAAPVDSQSAIAVVKVDAATAQSIYFRGRCKAALTVTDAAGATLYSANKELDHLTFADRDALSLPPLRAAAEDTPYGKLPLLDYIDCSTPLTQDPHPYLQSGFDKEQNFMTPGSAVEVSVKDILGKKARESANGWFAYRIGRGKLKPHGTYLVRIEYPEDKPRYCPIEIQAGRNYLDIGWQNGIKSDDPYEPWPLSKAWQYYDAVVSLDEETTGTAGTYGVSAENGFWIYFVNKVTADKYYCLYEGGPAVSHIKLYEIDAEKSAPRITLPPNLPHRLLMCDWERQADTDPEDTARFAKLMGYNAISPIMLKWILANWSDPLNGYESFDIDAGKYWISSDDAPGPPATPAVPGKESQHRKFLAATKRYDIQYIPRIEYGGSGDLPVEARAIGKDGNIAKPNRFASWGANLLNPATWDDFQKFADHLVKPFAQDNPQLTGVLWRIRCDRMQISYGRADLDLFAKDTGKLPAGTEAEQRAWASSGAGRAQYDDWWLAKRAAFHAKIAALLGSYRPDLKLYYYNWDGDKFGLILPSLTAWAFNKQVAFAKDGNGRAVYEKDRADRKKLTGQDYINVMHSGAFLAWNNADRADYALRPELYQNIKGVELFAPANALWCADSPVYLNYFKTAEGLAVSNQIMYDEIGARTINPRYEGSMVNPGGGPFSMAYEVLSYFHGDARTLTYTPYTYGRGFADAHRRFAQAFLALPAIAGTVVEQGDGDLKVRTYVAANGTYLGVAYRGYAGKKLSVKVPGSKAGATVRNLVTNAGIPSTFANDELQFELDSGPMELNAFLIQ